jgi:CRISPR-associated endonuclease Csy4
MKYYIEITLLPHAEIEWHFLWEKVYQQLHLALVAQAFEKEVDVDNSGNKKLLKVSEIGVSFPGRSVNRRHLGHQLRLFAQTQETLEQFDAPNRFKTLSDYVHLTSIKPVPDKVKGYGCYFRIQVQHNNEYLARRKTKAKKNALSFDDALKHFASREEPIINAPFVYVKSSSSGERFPLFIGYQDSEKSDCQGFSCYGLSRHSPVPIF